MASIIEIKNAFKFFEFARLNKLVREYTDQLNFFKKEFNEQ